MLDIKLPPSKYVCQSCKFYFERSRPGPITCIRCGHKYVDWINSQEVLKVIWKEWEKIDDIKRC
jgi:hypothetical protein